MRGEPHRHRPTSTHTHPSLTHCLWVTLGDSFLIVAAAEGWAGHAHEGWHMHPEPSLQGRPHGRGSCSEADQPESLTEMEALQL